LGPRFVGGRDTPDFGHAFTNYTYFRPCGRIWFSSVERARRLEGEKIKKEESPVKHVVECKFADNYRTSGGLTTDNCIQVLVFVAVMSRVGLYCKLHLSIHFASGDAASGVDYRHVTASSVCTGYPWPQGGAAGCECGDTKYGERRNLLSVLCILGLETLKVPVTDNFVCRRK